MSERLQRSLLRWYRRHRRPLPWRATRDPYAIWVSEIMLQQTRVETVLRYYPRFLASFPTVAALARAPESRVLALWSGLGYYGRARRLRQAARVVVAHHGGEVPREPQGLRTLPGVGRYTAGAIASIAFGKREAVLDGNVARVLARLFEISGSPRSSAFQRRVWQLAETLVPAGSPGDWNQALMELGATICTARAPACARCPVRTACGAAESGSVDRFPEPVKRAVTRKVRRACVVVEDHGRVLLARQDEGRLLRGLWRFPSAPVESEDEVANAVRRILRGLGVAVSSLRADGVVRHAIMDQRIETMVFRGALRGPRSSPAGARWFRWSELERLPLSSVELRVLAKSADHLSAASALG